MPWRSARDGRQLAAGSDGAVKVWDWTETDKPVHTFPGHENRVGSAWRSVATGSAWRRGAGREA